MLNFAGKMGRDSRDFSGSKKIPKIDMELKRSTLVLKVALKKASLVPVFPELASLRAMPREDFFYLLSLLLPLSLHSFHCSDKKATGFNMERGFLEETHFAPMTEL